MKGVSKHSISELSKAYGYTSRLRRSHTDAYVAVKLANAEFGPRESGGCTDNHTTGVSSCSMRNNC